MPTNNHPQLTGRNIHEAFVAARNSDMIPVPWGKPWEEMNAKEQAAYERMAQLLNERIKQPACWIATGRIGETVPFTVQLATSTIGESDAIEQALDAIYESGLDDWTKDQLINTLSVGKE